MRHWLCPGGKWRRHLLTALFARQVDPVLWAVLWGRWNAHTDGSQSLTWPNPASPPASQPAGHRPDLHGDVQHDWSYISFVRIYFFRSRHTAAKEREMHDSAAAVRRPSSASRVWRTAKTRERPVSNLSFLSNGETCVEKRLQLFWTVTTRCRWRSQPEPTASTRARRRLWWRCTTTYSWLLIRAMSLPCVWLIWLPPSTLLTVTFWCFDLNASLVSAVSSSSGSVHICRTDHFRSCTEAARRLWSLLFALYHKAPSWVRVCCLSDTWRTSLM